MPAPSPSTQSAPAQAIQAPEAPVKNASAGQTVIKPAHTVHNSLFTRLFPPPTFLEMRGCGLDISRHTIRLVQLQKTHKGLLLKHFDEKVIPPGAIYEDNIAQNKELRQALVELKKKYHLKFVAVSVPEEKGFLFRTTVPHVASASMRQNIFFQLEENIPLRADEVVFDYSVAKTFMEKGVEKCEVIVNAFPRHHIVNLVELLESVGLVPVGFYTTAEANARALVRKDQQGAALIVNLGGHHTGLYIVHNGIVQFTSTLNFGGEALTSAIAKHFSVSEDEARALKHDGELFAKGKGMNVFMSFINTLTVLKDEINRVLIYWHTHQNQERDPGREISKIILTGKDSSIQGLDEYLAITMKRKVVVANVWVNAFSVDAVIPPISLKDSLNYSAAVGLALQAHQIAYE